MMYSICYAEEFMTQHMDHLLLALYKAIIKKDNTMIQSRV